MTNLKKWRKISSLILTGIALLFSASLYFTGSPDYTYPEKVEAMLRANCENGNHCVVPIKWYATNGWMQPTIAGVVDGAYNTGYSIKDLAIFISDYAGSDSVRTEIHTMVAQLTDNPAVLWKTVKTSTIKLGDELQGDYGKIQGQYKTGRAFFEASTFFVGIGEVAVSVKGSKLTACLRRLTKLRRIKLGCPVCAKIFEKAYKLRKKLLQGENLRKTKALLNDDWLIAQKAGKSWDEFIEAYQAHHIIPLNMLDESDALKFYYNNGGKLDFNNIDNGIMIKKLNLGGAHANHPRYNKHILKELDDILAKSINDDYLLKEQVEIFEILTIQMVEDTRNKLIENCIKNSTKVNKLFNK
jgi:hypothetical protein